MEKEEKLRLTREYNLRDDRSGSVDVQIVILTERARELEEIVRRTESRDARLALVRTLGERRRMLSYLCSTDTKRYQILNRKVCSRT